MTRTPPDDDKHGRTGLSATARAVGIVPGASREATTCGKPRHETGGTLRCPPVRRLFTLCSALSLLLCAAVCVLWARSHVVVGDVLIVPYLAVPPHGGDAPETNTEGGGQTAEEGGAVVGS